MESKSLSSSVDASGAKAFCSTRAVGTPLIFILHTRCSLLSPHTADHDKRPHAAAPQQALHATGSTLHHQEPVLEVVRG